MAKKPTMTSKEMYENSCTLKGIPYFKWEISGLRTYSVFHGGNSK